MTKKLTNLHEIKITDEFLKTMAIAVSAYETKLLVEEVPTDEEVKAFRDEFVACFLICYRMRKDNEATVEEGRELLEDYLTKF